MRERGWGETLQKLSRHTQKLSLQSIINERTEEGAKKKKGNNKKSKEFGDAVGIFNGEYNRLRL